MILESKRFSFAKGTITTVTRVIPDHLPSTPLMDMLRRKAAKKGKR